MVLPNIPEDEAASRFPAGVYEKDLPSGKKYLRYTPQPWGAPKPLNVTDRTIITDKEVIAPYNVFESINHRRWCQSSCVMDSGRHAMITPGI